MSVGKKTKRDRIGDFLLRNASDLRTEIVSETAKNVPSVRAFSVHQNRLIKLTLGIFTFVGLFNIEWFTWQGVPLMIRLPTRL